MWNGVYGSRRKGKDRFGEVDRTSDRFNVGSVQPTIKNKQSQMFTKYQ